MSLDGAHSGSEPRSEQEDRKGYPRVLAEVIASAQGLLEAKRVSPIKSIQPGFCGVYPVEAFGEWSAVEIKRAMLEWHGVEDVACDSKMVHVFFESEADLQQALVRSKAGDNREWCLRRCTGYCGVDKHKAPERLVFSLGGHAIEKDSKLEGKEFQAHIRAHLAKPSLLSPTV